MPQKCPNRADLRHDVCRLHFVVREHYRNCRAFIFPGDEDFGITPVEAQACRCLVIAFGKGGALETVIDGVTGMFFREKTVECLKKAVTEFENSRFDKARCRENAERFAEETFRKSIQEFIEGKYKAERTAGRE
ncbi:MAG: glycosyltransferase [Clostridiales bacterium]|nr:glycosyltransferase [Clostridiales bacterium]